MSGLKYFIIVFVPVEDFLDKKYSWHIFIAFLVAVWSPLPTN
jgi:hypothetical protein